MLDEGFIHKNSQQIVELCQTPDTALTALAYWIKYENVEQDAICAIYKRICADMDVLFGANHTGHIRAKLSHRHPAVNKNGQ